MDHQESNQMEGCSGPVQCRNGCGFYAGSGTEGLCSVCYKDAIKKKQQPPTGMPASLAPSEPRSSGASSASVASLSIATSSGIPEATGQSGKPDCLETASPTVILPSAIQTDKRTESECLEGGGASASVDLEGHPSSANTSSSATAAAGDETPDGKDGKKKKNRCQSCKKKVGLTGFTCRCGGLFCSIHRYSDKHECNFDYKQLGAQEIKKANPVVMAEKVKKI